MDDRLPSIFSKSPKTGSGIGSPDKKLDPLTRKLKNQLATLANRSTAAIAERDSELSSLKSTVATLQGIVQKQKEELSHKERAIAELTRSDHVQNRSLARSSQNTEAEILSLKTKLREAADTHKEALAAAVEAGERALKERNALANALAYLSQKALGGNDQGSKIDAQKDMECILAEGGEAIPRLPRVWLGLTYEADGQGHLISPAPASGLQRGRGASSEASFALGLGGRFALPKPFNGDGSRAVAALAKQVTRLWRQRGIYRARCREAMDHLRKVQAAVDDVDQDFTMVNVMIDRLVNEAERMSIVLGLKPLAESLRRAEEEADEPEGGPVRQASNRMAAVQAVLKGLFESVMVLQEEAKVMKASSGQMESIHEAELSGHRNPGADNVVPFIDAIHKYRDELWSIYGSDQFVSRESIQLLLDSVTPTTKYKPAQETSSEVAGTGLSVLLGKQQEEGKSDGQRIEALGASPRAAEKEEKAAVRQEEEKSVPVKEDLTLSPQGLKASRGPPLNEAPIEAKPDLEDTPQEDVSDIGAGVVEPPSKIQAPNDVHNENDSEEEDHDEDDDDDESHDEDHEEEDDEE